MDHPRRARARARPARGAAVRGAAADPGPQLQPRREWTVDRPARPQDRPRGNGGVPAVHGRERQGLAGARRSAGDLPLPRPERVERPHLQAGPHARRPLRARSDYPDRHGPRAAARRRRGARGRAHARFGGARRPDRRLLGPRAGQRAHAAQHGVRSLRRRRLPGRRRRERREPEWPPPLPRGDAVARCRRAVQATGGCRATWPPTSSRRRRMRWQPRRVVRSRWSSGSSRASRTCSPCASWRRSMPRTRRARA